MSDDDWETVAEPSLGDLSLGGAPPAPADDDDGWLAPMGTLRAEMRERPSGAPKVLMRRTGAGDAARAPADAKPAAAKTEDERARDYAAARARIMGDAKPPPAAKKAGSWASQALAASREKPAAGDRGRRPPRGGDAKPPPPGDGHPANARVARGPHGEGVGFDARSRERARANAEALAAGAVYQIPDRAPRRDRPRAAPLDPDYHRQPVTPIYEPAHYGAPPPRGLVYGQPPYAAPPRGLVYGKGAGPYAADAYGAGFPPPSPRCARASRRLRSA